MLSRVFLFSWLLLCSCGSAPRPADTAKQEKPTTELLLKTYRVPHDYLNLLETKVHEETNDPFGIPPVSGTMLRDLKPSVILKQLHLEFREGYTICYIGSENILLFYADEKGHRDFDTLHRKLKIPISQIKKP